MVLIKRLQRPLDFIRTFVEDFLTVPRASASAFYDWPSRGSTLGYEPDRSHARLCAQDLTDVLSKLFDWLVQKQDATIKNPAKACKAKVSMISHSMGNYVVQKAMAAAWTRKNQPLLVSLINQLLMVAADVDSDLFD